MSSYWIAKSMGLVFKAGVPAPAGVLTPTQYFQKGVWTQVHFRNEYFDTAGQYFPPISTFKPTAVGKYNIRAQIQIDDILAETPDLEYDDRHKITAAIYKDGISIKENSVTISNYYPDDPREDATVVVEAVVDLTEAEVAYGSTSNEFTAWVLIENIRPETIPDDYNPYDEQSSCSIVNYYGCTDQNAHPSSYDSSATIDDGSCYFNPGCPDPAYLSYWESISTNFDPTDLANIGGVTVDYPAACSGTLTIYGCTDPTADNEDVTANVNDGSCTYGGSP